MDSERQPLVSILIRFIYVSVRKRIEDPDLFPLRFNYDLLNLKVEIGVDLKDSMFTIKLDGIAYRDLQYQDYFRSIHSRDGLSGDVLLNDV